MQQHLQFPDGYTPPSTCATCGARIMLSESGGVAHWVHLGGDALPDHEVKLMGMWWDVTSGWRKPDELTAKSDDGDPMLHGGPNG